MNTEYRVGSPRLTLAEWKARQTERNAFEFECRDINTKNAFIEAQMAKADEFFSRHPTHY
jgi:hypothetical protein